MTSGEHTYIEKNNLPIQEVSGEISLKQIFITGSSFYFYLLKKWHIILAFVVLGGVLGLIYANSKKVSFIATCTFVLEDGGGSSAMGQYAGIASMVGVDLGGAGGGIFQGDNLLELYKSRSMLEKTLLSEVEIDGKRQLLINRYIEMNKLRKSWSKNPQLLKVRFSSKLDKPLTRVQDSIITSIVGSLNASYLTVAKPDKKLSIIKVDVKAQDESFAKLFNDKIVQNVNDFYVQTKTKKALENYSILEHQTDSIRRVLNGNISKIASSIDANPNANYARQILKIPSQKGQIDVEANKAILTELVKNLELSKVSLRKEAPLIQIIDTPVFPLESIHTSKAKCFVVGGIVLGFFSVLFFIAKKILQGIML